MLLPKNVAFLSFLIDCIEFQKRRVDNEEDELSSLSESHIHQKQDSHWFKCVVLAVRLLVILKTCIFIRFDRNQKQLNKIEGKKCCFFNSLNTLGISLNDKYPEYIRR